MGRKGSWMGREWKGQVTREIGWGIGRKGGQAEGGRVRQAYRVHGTIMSYMEGRYRWKGKKWEWVDDQRVDKGQAGVGKGYYRVERRGKENEKWQLKG